MTGIAGASAWYDPAMGPIADLAIGDYLISSDIVSAMKPNPSKGKSDALNFAGWLTSPPIQMYLQARGKTTNLAPIENAIKQFDFDPDSILEDMPMPPPMPPNQATPGNPLPIQVPQQEQPLAVNH